MIEVIVNQSDFDRVISAINRIEKVVLNFKDSITEESAREFSDALKQNVTSQKFGDFGAPHGDWKKGQTNADKYWEWLGTALKSIKPNKLLSTADFSKWFVGFEYGGGSSAGGGSLTKKSVGIKKSAKTTWAQKVAASQKHGDVKHIDPKGYVLKKKVGDTRTITFGKEIKRKKIISDTSND